jgi:hypothetical protein
VEETRIRRYPRLTRHIALPDQRFCLYFPYFFVIRGFLRRFIRAKKGPGMSNDLVLRIDVTHGPGGARSVTV